jgi:hypothetical protein
MFVELTHFRQERGQGDLFIYFFILSYLDTVKQKWHLLEARLFIDKVMWGHYT